MIRTGRAALVKGHQLSGLLYPAPVVDLSQDPSGPLLLGLMRQESAFNHRAVSPAGARGLMQVMPGTAESVARRLGLSYSIDRLTSDPHYNISLGRDYLERMLDRYDGFLPLALAEELRLLRFGEKDIRMTAQILPERGGAALAGADDQKIRQASRGGIHVLRSAHPAQSQGRLMRNRRRFGFGRIHEDAASSARAPSRLARARSSLSR